MRLRLIGDWDGTTIEEIGERFDSGVALIELS